MVRKLISFVQNYTIFSSKKGLILLPVIVNALARGLFLLFNQNNYSSFTVVNSIFLPLVLDVFLFLIASLFFVKKASKPLLFFFCFYLFLSNLIFYHHFKIYFLPPGTGAIAALFETTPLEAMEFTKLTSISSLLETLLLSLLPLLSLFFVKKINYPIKIKFNSILLMLVPTLVILCGNFSPNHAIENPINDSYIYRDAENIYHYFQEYFKLVRLRENRQKSTFNAQQNDSLKTRKQTHVLVIGESLSRNHMSLYGYHRNTTPLLDTNKSIIKFNRVFSPTTQTRTSIVRMLTTSFGLNTTKFYDEGSIITALKDAGYATYWISNQGRYGISDTETSAIAEDAENTRFVNTDWNSKSLDEKVLKELNNVLKKDESHQFIIIHLLGSHFEYTKRVPDIDYISIKEPIKSSYLNDYEKLRIDEYDRTVKYTDFVIDSLIKTLSNQCDVSSMVFVSDHGEDIYDDGKKIIGHGSAIVTRFTVEIPFIVWQSDSFETIRKLPNQESNWDRIYNNGNLFHSLADLYLLNFEEKDSTRSIFYTGENPYSYSYIINSNNKKINYDELRN